MKRMYKTGWILCLSLGFTLATVSGEVKVEQKSQMKFGGALGKMMNLFGGKAAKEGITSTVAVKGDRKSTTSDNRMEIIDLAEEKVYEVDLKNKSYKVTTFEQMRQELAKQREKLEKSAERGKDQPQREMEMDFDVKATGQKKTINGFDCNQFITTITIREKGKTLEQAGGMVMTVDSWLAPSVNSEKEISDFDLRYARKLQSEAVGDMAAQMAQAMAMYPGLEKAMTKMRSEKVNMEGSSILATMTFESVPSKEQLAQQQKQEKEEEGGGGLLGGFAKRLGRKKSDDQQQGAAGGRSTFMTGTTEVLSLATTVAAADVAVPEGFKLKK